MKAVIIKHWKNRTGDTSTWEQEVIQTVNGTQKQIDKIVDQCWDQIGLDEDIEVIYKTKTPPPCKQK